MATNFFSVAELGIRGLKPGAIQKQALWKNRGAHYLRGTNFRSDATITVDPASQRQILSLIGDVAPSIAAAFVKNLVPLAERAQREWPVKTGLSQALVSLEFTVTPDGKSFIGEVRNRAPYAFFINRARTVKSLIFEPGERVARVMATELLDQVGR